jgi:short-subunit dehydrogenase
MAPIAFITGASSGLGWELSWQLAQQGYDLALLARRRHLLESLAEKISPLGRRVILLEADVSDWDAMQKAIQRTEQELGPIDLLIANAGVSLDLPVKRWDPLAAKKVFDINMIGLIYTVSAVLPSMMQRRRGHIVGVSSLASYLAIPRSTIYCASKAAARYYLQGLRLELAPYQIKVTTICPGFVKTPMTDKNKFPMPFLMDVEPAVALMVKGIQRGRESIHFPWPLYALVRLASSLPTYVLRRLLQRTRPT